MTRLHRIDPKMGWHHVANHAAGQQDLFLSDENRHLFLRLLVWAAERTGVEVAGFCLMGNHFHLVVHCPDGRLSQFMQLVESVYARALVGHRGYRGPVFVDRFHNTVITSDEQLLVATRYVDRNPLELGFDLNHYPWSSYRTHITGSGAHDAALSRSAAFPVRLCGGPDAYRAFVSTDGPSDKFAFADNKRVAHATAYVPIKTQLREIAHATAVASGTSLDQILAPRRGLGGNPRLAAVHVAHDRSIAFAHELCEFFGYAARSSLTSAVTRAQRKLVTHIEFRALVAQIEATLHPDQHALAS